jgi:WD40 repeat protein
LTFVILVGAVLLIRWIHAGSANNQLFKAQVSAADVGVVALVVALLTAIFALYRRAIRVKTVFYLEVVQDNAPPPVNRPEELQKVILALLSHGRPTPVLGSDKPHSRESSLTVTICTSLHGVGGFGKTTLARMVLQDGRIVDWFGDAGIYWVVMGRENVTHELIAARVGELVAKLGEEARSSTDIDDAAAQLKSALSLRRRALIVLDDVWEARQVAPFTAAVHPGVRILVTTRSTTAVPGAQVVTVDRVTMDQAREILTRGISGLSSSSTDKLLAVTGQWPLILNSVNRLLLQAAPVTPSQRVSGAVGGSKRVVEERAAALLERYERSGLSGFDDLAGGRDYSPEEAMNDPELRAELVRSTIDAGRSLLSEKHRVRLRDLAIFAEDALVPRSLIRLLWEHTQGFDSAETDTLLQRLSDFGLIMLDKAGDEIYVGMHDVYRDELLRECAPEDLAQLNVHLLSAAAQAWHLSNPSPVEHLRDQLQGVTPPGQGSSSRKLELDSVRWDELPEGCRYLRDNLAFHLREAGSLAASERVVTHPAWIASRLMERGPLAPLSDLREVGTTAAREVGNRLLNISHLLNPTEPRQSLRAILWNQMRDWPEPSWLQVPSGGLHYVPEPPLHAPYLRGLLPSPDTPPAAARAVLLGHDGPSIRVAVAPTGSWIASTGQDGTLRIWDVADFGTGKVRAVLDAHRGGASGVDIDAEGKTLITTGEDGVVKIWDADTMAVRESTAVHSNAVGGVAIAPEGTWAVTASDDRTVGVWDMATGNLSRRLRTHRDWALGVAIARDGTWFATAGGDRCVRIWDSHTLRPRRVLNGHEGPVNSVAIDPTQTWMVTSSHDGTVRVWDVASWRLLKTLNGNGEPTRGVAISPDGRQFSSVGNDGIVRLWSADDFTTVAMLTGHTKWVRSVAYSPDGSWLATTSDDGTVRVWNVANRADSLTDSGRSGIDISFYGDRLVSCLQRQVTIWSSESGKSLETILSDRSDVTAIAWSPSDCWLATATESGQIDLWRLDDQEKIASLEGHSGRVNAIDISADDRWFVSAGEDGRALVWDGASCSLVGTLLHSGPVNSVAIAQGARWLATAGQDGQVRLWDSSPSYDLLRSLSSGSGAAGSIAISPDERWLAYVSGGESIAVWDLDANESIAALDPRLGPLSSLAFSPDGEELAIVASRGEVQVWNVQASQPMATMRVCGSLGGIVWKETGIYLSGPRGVHGFAMEST